ncbi:hypothetical protein EDC04DRAFT_762458 [Pisolithus marmoratus]|nr:hypothetical protein EDC04DRAFT_762458 [Pisolithus marmoratus]
MVRNGMQIRQPPFCVAHPFKPGDLTRSLWTTRAWTLQELPAPKVILFYDSKWKPYLSDAGRNHTEFPVTMQELAGAFDIRVRARLRLVSTRNATVADIAYTLIDIFK